MMNFKCRAFMLTLLCMLAFGAAQASGAEPVSDVKVKIGIIGAMDVEVDLLKEALNISRAVSRAGMEFAEGRLNDKDVVAVKCGVGKVNAAVCTQILIDEFHVTHIINTGVAGALNNSLHIGDIVIGADAVQYDYDVSPVGFKKGEVLYTGLVAFKLDDALRQRLARAVMEAAPNVRAIEGRICTGDQFIANSAQKDAIISDFNGDCCEMEGLNA